MTPGAQGESVSHGTVRVLVAFAGDREARAALALVEDLAADHPLDLSLVAVACFVPCLSAWAPLSGLTTAAALHDDATLGADRLARRVCDALPPGVHACRAVALGWRSARLLSPLRAGVFDALVLGAPVGLRRRAAARAAGSSGTRLIVPRAGRGTPAAATAPPPRPAARPTTGVPGPARSRAGAGRARPRGPRA